MRKEDIPEQLSLDASEAQALENRIAESPLSEEDKKIMVGLIHFSLWMQQQLERAKLSIHRLKKLFGFKTEKKKTVAREPDIDKDETGKELAKHKVTAESLLNNRGSDSGKTKRNPEENHGRYGAADYPGCATEEIKHETLNAKTPCPDCAESETVGKLYRIKSGILIRLTGQPLIGGKCYLIEKWRCGVCGKIYRAEVPSSIANEPKHAPSCLTNIALGRYYFGLPFKRMEQWLKLEGIRLADATQWTKLSQMVESLKPLHKALEKQAAQGEGKFYDDTPNRIIDVMKRSYQETGRKGVYTTAIVSQQGERRMYLFYTSQRIAAENVYPLLEKDQRKGWFFTMSDASANNLPKEVSESLLARWILCFCLVHGRRSTLRKCVIT